MADTSGQPPVVTESMQTHTPLDPRAGPACSHKGTLRSYGNGGRTSHHLCRCAGCSPLCPMCVNRRAVLGVTLARSSATS